MLDDVLRLRHRIRQRHRDRFKLLVRLIRHIKQRILYNLSCDFSVLRILLDGSGRPSHTLLDGPGDSRSRRQNGV